MKLNLLLTLLSMIITVEAMSHKGCCKKNLEKQVRRNFSRLGEFLKPDAKPKSWQ